jgi:hypothetical protein
MTIILTQAHVNQLIRTNLNDQHCVPLENIENIKLINVMGDGNFEVLVEIRDPEYVV